MVLVTGRRRRSAGFQHVTVGPLNVFPRCTDYIIHPFRGESTSPCQKLARVLPLGIVDEPSSRWRSVEREARLLIAMPSLDGLGVPAIHFLVRQGLLLEGAFVDSMNEKSVAQSTAPSGALYISFNGNSASLLGSC